MPHADEVILEEGQHGKSIDTRTKEVPKVHVRRSRGGHDEGNTIDRLLAGWV